MNSRIATVRSGFWIAIAFTAFFPVELSAQVFQEQGGLLVIEAESMPPKDQWVKESSIGGYTGSGYYRWDGPLLLNDHSQGIIGYTFNISTPGVYNFRLRSHHPPGDRYNDCWSRMDSDSWVKAYASAPAANQWVWHTQFDYGTSHPQASYNLSTGQHTLYISGRAHDFSIDRIHLYMNSVSNGTSASLPESPTSGTTPPPPPPPPPPGGLAVESLTLINANAGSVVATHDPLAHGATLYLGDLPSAINVRANVVGGVESVNFTLNGAQHRMENSAPYALFGDSGTGTYYSWSPSASSYTVVATPHPSDNAGGQAGTTLTVTFTVKAGSAPAPPPPPPAADPDQGLSPTQPDSGVQAPPSENGGVVQPSDLGAVAVQTDADCPTCVSAAPPKSGVVGGCSVAGGLANYPPLLLLCLLWLGIRQKDHTQVKRPAKRPHPG